MKKKGKKTQKSVLKANLGGWVLLTVIGINGNMPYAMKVKKIGKTSATFVGCRAGQWIHAEAVKYDDIRLIEPLRHEEPAGAEAVMSLMKWTSGPRAGEPVTREEYQRVKAQENRIRRERFAGTGNKLVKAIKSRMKTVKSAINKANMEFVAAEMRRLGIIPKPEEPETPWHRVPDTEWPWAVCQHYNTCQLLHGTCQHQHLHPYHTERCCQIKKARCTVVDVQFRIHITRPPRRHP